MRWRDRITGVLSEAPPLPLANGQWEACEGGDLLLADANGQVPGLPNMHSPRASQVPDANLARILTASAPRLQVLEDKPLVEWLTEPTLMPPVKGDLDESPLEKAIAAGLPRLEAVCRSPRTHLTRRAERQLVSRCKRLAPRALEELSRRTEDWEARTILGIRPKRVLGVVRDDLYAFYENHIAVRLVDHLARALAKRDAAISAVVDAAQSHTDWSDDVANINWRRQERVCALWGNAWNDSTLGEQAREAQVRVRRLKRRVLGLKGSVLYRQLGRNLRPMALRMTNIFTNDDAYRGVAELWRAWEKATRTAPAPPKERWRGLQEDAAHFERFAQLLTIRALDAIKYTPTDDDARIAGPLGPIVFGTEGHDFTLTCARDGSVLRVVPLYAALAEDQTIDAFLEAMTAQAERIIVLYPGTQRHPRLQGAGPIDSWPIFVPVAPLALESVERVARALRWALWSRALKTYRTPFELKGQAPPALVDGVALEGSGLVLQAPLDKWPSLQNERRELAAQLTRLKNAEDKTRSKGRQRHARSNKNAMVGLQRDLEARVALLERIEAWIKIGIWGAESCPICESTSVKFENDETAFRATCTECCGHWGLVPCHCGASSPYLMLDSAQPHTNGIDRTHGADVIAFPIRPDVFHCTSCGQPTDGEPHERA